MSMPKSLLYFFFTVLLVSCGGGDSSSDSDSVENGDSSETSIIEHELNEDRLDAVGYNNELSSILDGTLNSIDELFFSDSSNVALNLDNAIFEINLNLSTVQGMASFGEEEGFRIAMIELLEFYKQELEGIFTDEIKDILLQDVPSEADQNRLEEYDEDFTARELEFFQKVVDEQEIFAKENNIRLSS